MVVVVTVVTVTAVAVKMLNETEKRIEESVTEKWSNHKMLN
jgi:hypothetical protein